jgi:hypothetical protein
MLTSTQARDAEAGEPAALTRHAGPEPPPRRPRPTTRPDSSDALRRSVLPTSSASLVGLDHGSETRFGRAISSADLEAISTPDP